jgi:penicillin G amidase
MKKIFVLLICSSFIAQIFVSAHTAASSQKESAADRARSLLSQTSGQVELPGLSKPVEVFRDPWGVPHIFARTTADLFFAQGYVAAQDRLWQMELWRRTGEGKLSEILGRTALERDKFARLLGYRGDMQAEWKSYAPDARAIIEAFVKGVNAYIESNRQRLPIEFQLTGVEPELWTPEVCLTRMAGYIMTRNASSEILRAQLVTLLGPQLAGEWLESEPKTTLEVAPDLDLRGIDNKILTLANAASAPISFGNLEGSNNWVVSGALTASGKPLLANDPHRPILTPSLRYITHLNAPGWNVIGAGEPTLPGVAAGHNERVGFGFTIVGLDQQDLYVEELNPQNPNQYRYKGRWRAMELERQQIKVKGEAAVEVELKFTRHGPVMYEDRQRHRAYALRWVGSEPGSAGYLASLSLNRANNWEEFLKALERWKVPSENLVYADIDGNIGWQAAGLAPIRPNWKGLLPVPGGKGEYEWQGFMRLADLPRSYNPAKQFIATANHNIIPPGYKRGIGFEWSAPFRFRRIEEVLAAGRDFSVADFQRLQHDETSLIARELVPLLKGLKFAQAGAQQAVKELLQWDFVLSKDSRAAAIYEVWLEKLRTNLFKPVVPAAAWPLVGGRISLERLLQTVKQPDKRIFGVEAQARVDAALKQSLEEALDDLRKRLGERMADWRWGALHKAEFSHQLAGPATRQFFNLPPVERGGDANTVNATAGGGYRQSAGASYRQILDLSDWDNSVAINVPGQSGQPGSPHYGDLLALWGEGKYFPLLFSRQKIEQHSRQRLLLVPKN